MRVRVGPLWNLPRHCSILSKGRPSQSVNTVNTTGNCATKQRVVDPQILMKDSLKNAVPMPGGVIHNTHHLELGNHEKKEKFCQQSTRKELDAVAILTP